MGSTGALYRPAGRIASLWRTVFLPLLVMLLVSVALAEPTEARPRTAAVLVEADTGRVLHARNAHVPLYPASLTKMMTLYLTFEALESGRLSLREKLPVSQRAAARPPTKLGVRPNRPIQVEHAILGLVTRSANDAATVLAEALGGTETAFARKMTAKARQLGMQYTTFRNASGLPDSRQISTAADMAVLARALIDHFPQYYAYFSRKSFVWQGQVYRNHNHLLSNYTGTDGIKTGYIRASGFNLVASARRNGRHLIAVVFGGKTARSRDREVMALLDRGFAQLGSSPTYVAMRLGPLKNPPLPQPKPQAPAMTAVADRGLAPTSIGSRELAHLSFASAPTAAGPTATPVLLTPETTIAALARSAPSLPLAPEPSPGLAVEQWGIQVGAFSHAAAAERQLARVMNVLSGLLPDHAAQIVPIASGHSTLYRARFGKLSEAAAKDACARLMPAEIGCLILSPLQQIVLDNG